MLSQDSLERSVRRAGVDALPRFLEVTGSTNAEALAMAGAGAPEWTVVAAGHQTAGRGRLGRSWDDAPGKALLFSVILRPGVPPEDAPLLSLLAATELVDAIASPRLRSKWPNDLVVDERKVGGILPEARVAGGRLVHLVMGIGVNVAMAPEDFPADLRGGATSLRAEGVRIDAGALLTAFLGGFRNRVDSGPDRIVDAYRSVCGTLGRRVRVSTAGGHLVDGMARDLDERGALIVESSGRRRVVGFGEVTHLETP